MEKVLYNSIGDGYNSTRKADPFIAECIYKSIYTGKDKIYLDIGCGTGNYTIALNNKGLTLYGIDPSEKMLETALQRNSNITWVKGKAENIPVRDNFFGGIFGTLTLHHWTDIEKGFKELYRVLHPGGRIAFFTSAPGQMERYWLNHYFPVMMEQSIKQMPEIASLEKAAVNSGFELLSSQKYFVKDDLQDHFLYVGKNRPEIYFDNVIRHGISSFAALSNADEVDKGLAKLKEDLRTGTFQSVRESYENNEGDYFIFKAVKPVI